MLEAPLLEEPAREALRQAAAALDLAERRGQPYEMSLALTAVARGYGVLDVHATAEAYFELALRWARAAGSTDHTVDLLCSLCETAARLASAQDAAAPGSGHAARERARDHAFEASTLAGRVADSAWEVTVLLRISDVLDRFGDRDDAVLLQTRALRLMSGVAPEVVQVASLGRLADG
jgi:hypothetical protein